MASVAVNNGSFMSPVATADFPVSLNANTGGLLSRAYNGVSSFNLFVSLLLILIAYDQCECVMREEQKLVLFSQIQIVVD